MMLPHPAVAEQFAQFPQSDTPPLQDVRTTLLRRVHGLFTG